MGDRREFLKKSVLGAAAIPAVAASAAALEATGKAVPPPAQGRGGNSFPNARVQSHAGDEFLLYDDLVRDRVVGINFISIRGHEHFPATTHLRRVADALGSRLGQDVFLYSITTDPSHDTVERLAEFAKQQGVGGGWLLLRSAASDVATVSRRLHKHGHNSAHPVRMVHYGHGGLNIWGAFGVDSEPEFAAERFSWVQLGKSPEGGLRRAGPRRLTDNLKSGNNRV